MQTVNSQHIGSSFTNLLLHYMDGQITDRSWDKIMKTVDQEGLTRKERMAFARFMNERIEDPSSDSLHVPGPAELEQLLSEIREPRN